MGSVTLPLDHDQRRSLADEVHARPPAPVAAPAAVSCLALYDADADAVFAKICELAVLQAAETPSPDAGHAIVELGGGRSMNSTTFPPRSRCCPQAGSPRSGRA
jgi:uncharacterized membrane-anchored protein